MIHGQDFLTLAGKLAAGTTEAEWRSAISRAYYAGFHVARELLSGCGFTVPKGDRSHSYLWRRLTNAGDKNLATAGLRLNAYRTDRNRADYDLSHTVEKGTTVAGLQGITDVIQLLKAAATHPISPNVIEAIKTYERDVLKEVTWSGP